jgi:glycosyltransferase involved in cell wall biosynthesis
MLVRRVGGGGGQQLQARQVSLALRQRGVPVCILTDQKRGRRFSTPTWAARLPTDRLKVRGQADFLRQCFRYLLQHRHAYDVVHLHGFGPEFWVALAARRITGRPLVVKPGTAGTGTKLGLYAGWSSRFPKWLTRPWSGVDAWISISGQTRADLRAMGVSDERIVDSPNGVDTSRFFLLPEPERAAVRAAAGFQPEDVVLCTATRLLPHKRVDLLLDTFLRVAAECPNFHFRILGDGQERKSLEAIAAASPHGSRVQFCGHLDANRVIRVLQSADIFGLLSAWEGLSNALLEAMACGLAPLVADVSGMGDVVEAGRNGMIVAPKPEAASAALTRLVREASFRIPLGAAAAETVRERYTLDRTVDRLLDLYRRLTPGQKPLG